MDSCYWIRLLPWRQKNKANSKSAQIKFAPELKITHNDGWVQLELQLVNRSSWTVWVQEATAILIDLDAESQTEISTGEATLKILQNIRPNETLSVSLARTIYDAAGRPQGTYSCLVLTNVRYHIFDEWCNAQLHTYRVEMAALTVVDLHSSRWYDKKMKRMNIRADFEAQKHEG